jgi:hypothetical protein
MDQLLPQIAQHLPEIVDGMTPDGQLPSGKLLDAGLAFLKSRATPNPKRLAGVCGSATARLGRPADSRASPPANRRNDIARQSDLMLQRRHEPAR